MTTYISNLAMILALGGLCGAGAAGTAAVTAGDDPAAVVDRFQAAYRQGSVEAMLALYAPDATFEDVNQHQSVTGTEELREMLVGLVGVHHAMGLTETRRLVQGDTVVVEYAYTGQLNGAAIGASVGKVGCPDLSYEILATSWYRVTGGRIMHQKDFLDWAAYLDLRERMLAAGKDAPAGGTPGR